MKAPLTMPTRKRFIRHVRHLRRESSGVAANRQWMLCFLGFVALTSGFACEHDPCDPCGERFWAQYDCIEEADDVQDECNEGCLGEQTACEDACNLDPDCIESCWNEAVDSLATCGADAQENIHSCWESVVE